MATFVFDEFSFDDVRYLLTRSGTPVKADTQVLELLAYLLKNPGRVVTKEELIDEIWQGRALGDNVISVCVAKLRKALGGGDNRCIGNVYGRGYRFMRPVSLREPAAEPPRAATPMVVHSTRTDASLVGRSFAMSQLDAALTRAKSGRGGVCALLGEAGIGKTRVAEALEARAPEAGFQVAWGHCHPFGDVPPLWPFLQVLRAWDVQLPAALVTGEAAASERDEPERGDAEQLDAWSRHDGDAWHKTVLFMTETVARMCESQPRLIVFEDMQWADTASLRLLSHEVAAIAQLPLLIVMTVRDTQLPAEPRSRRALDYVLGHRDVSRIKLARLLKSDVEAYTTELLGNADTALAEAVYKKSEGNPFFMVELLRPIADGGRLGAAELTLSGPALDIVRQALQQLPKESRDALAAASVIGRSFDLGLLASVTQRSPDVLIELLETAMSSHVIVAQRDSHTRFAFGHDLIRDVLYEDLPSIARARLHLKVADGLGARASSDASLSSSELAHHLLSALPAGDVTRAITSAREAARAAARIGAHSDGCVLLRRAFEALQLRPEIEPHTACELLYDLARCERAAGEPTFSAHLDQAVALARRHGFSDVLVGASQMASGPPGTVSVDNANDILEAALHALPASERGQRAMLLAHLSWTPPHSWKKQRVDKLLDEAASLAQTSGNAALGTVLRAQLYYACGPDDHERALTIANQMERLVSSSGKRQRARWALEPEIARILVQLQRGDLTQAQRAIDSFAAAARELHHAELIWHADRFGVILRMNRGDYAYARTALSELKKRADQLQLHARKTVEFADWGELLRRTEERAPAPAAVLTSQIRPVPSDGPMAFSGKLRIMTLFGLLEDARIELDALPIQDLYDLPKSRDYLATLGHFAQTAIATGSQKPAAALYELLLPYPHLCMATISLHCFGPVARMLGGLARLLGQRKQAVAHFEMAVHDTERFGLLPELAQARYQYAQLLAEGDGAERKQARELSTRAREVAQQLGMKPLQTACEQLLGEVA